MSAWLPSGSLAQQPTGVAILTSAESDLTAAANRLRNEKSLAPLQQSIARIDGVQVQGATLAAHKAYWSAYGRYLLAMHFQKSGEVAAAGRVAVEGARLLEASKNRDVENFALHAMLISLQFSAAAPRDYPTLAREQRRSLERALELGPRNLRALYINAATDFGTPSQFGGGRLAEGYLRRAIAMPVEAERPLAPDWGRDLCVALLTHILTNSGRSAEAEQILTDERRNNPNKSLLRAPPTPTKR
ncbi:MAG: hypothetical protein ING71_00335 [Rhodocyclaceae bacterium]|nr:hypothetical protein [Rhodocyclaceae bacterium]